MSTTEPPEPGASSDEKAWEEMAKNILRAEMMRNGVSYAALADRLSAFGIKDNELNLRNKVSRGRFTAVFLMQCLKALNVEWIHVPSSVEDAARKGGAQTLAARRGRRRNDSPAHIIAGGMDEFFAADAVHSHLKNDADDRCVRVGIKCMRAGPTGSRYRENEVERGAARP